MQSNSPTELSLMGAPEPFDLGSANGERELSRRVGKVVGYPPLSELGDLQRRSSKRRC